MMDRRGIFIREGDPVAWNGRSDQLSAIIRTGRVLTVTESHILVRPDAGTYDIRLRRRENIVRLPRILEGRDVEPTSVCGNWPDGLPGGGGARAEPVLASTGGG